MRVFACTTWVAGSIAVAACRGETPVPSVALCDDLGQALCRRAPTRCEAIGQALRDVEPAQVPTCESTMSAVTSIEAVAPEQRATFWRVVLEQAQASSPAIATAVGIAATADVGGEGRTQFDDDALVESAGMFPAGFPDLVIRIDPRRILVESKQPSSHAITGDEAALDGELRREAEDGKRRAGAVGEEFEGMIRLHVAADTPYATVWAVVGVASKAGFGEFRLATRQGAVLRETVAWPVDDVDLADALVLRIAEDGVSIEPDAQALDAVALDRVLGQRKQADPARSGSAVRPSGATPWREVVRALDRARGPECDQQALLLDDGVGPQCWFWQHMLVAPR